MNLLKCSSYMFGHLISQASGDKEQSTSSSTSDSGSSSEEEDEEIMKEESGKKVGHLMRYI